MSISNTLYGKEILDSIRKSKKRFLKMMVGLGIFEFSIMGIFVYLFYIEGELEKLQGEASVFGAIVAGCFWTAIGITAWKKPEKVLNKIMNKSLKTDQLKGLFLEELNQKPSSMLQLKKNSGKVLFTKHFAVHYNEKSGCFNNVTIMRLEDMDQVTVSAARSNGIVVSYVHKYEKKNNQKCVQKISFVRENDSDGFLRHVSMLRPQLEIKG